MYEKPKIKIGLLIDPLRKLYDWEIKLIYEIIFSNIAEITCIFYDPSSRKIQKSFIKKLIYNFRNHTIYSSILRKIIELIENKHTKTSSSDKLEVVKNFFSLLFFQNRKKRVIFPSHYHRQYLC